MHCFAYPYLGTTQPNAYQRKQPDDSTVSEPGLSKAKTSGTPGSPEVQNGNNNNHFEEWKRCRDTCDRFDNYQLDLRKYGFTLITGILTAGSFLGFAGPTKGIQSAVIIVTMILVVVLFWLDTYYQSLIYGLYFVQGFWKCLD